MSAAGAALEIAGRRNATAGVLGFGGTRGGRPGVMDAVRAMMAGLPHVRLVENGWQTWPRFRETVRHMHLLLQPSYTESFNMVTADGVAEAWRQWFRTPLTGRPGRGKRDSTTWTRLPGSAATCWRTRMRRWKVSRRWKPTTRRGCGAGKSYLEAA